ncbi:MAG: hypothetical protein M1465_01785 [Candidatus Marsarchaeota archaeon]|nr:hypothetical protein [Candidatus Marsarchaeota archaeon]
MAGENLTKKLDAPNKDELISLLLNIANLRKENLEWLGLKLEGASGEQEALTYFKGKIKACIFNDSRPNLKEARRLISNFKKISKDEKLVLELMVFYVETGIRLGEKYGDLYEAFYTSMENMFYEIIGLLNDRRTTTLKEEFTPRLNWIVEHATEGR